MNGMNARKLVFVDESGFNLWISRTRDRGQRAVRSVGESRGCPNFTLILAVSKQLGIIHHDFFKGGTIADRFNAWLRAASGAAGDPDAMFIFDHVPAHRRFLNAGLSTNHKGKFSPEYSPFLNIAKNCFSFKRQMTEAHVTLRISTVFDE